MPLQATSGAASYDAFGGGVPVVPNYIEDVFSTYLYTGNGSTQTITNGIDLAGKGGMVWIKGRDTSAQSATSPNRVFDTLRGAGAGLVTNTTAAQGGTGNLSSFDSTGFSLNTNRFEVNGLNSTYASWTFRKQPKFFDVVTYTGNGSSPRDIAHSLGSVPGCIFLKRTDSADNWIVYHRSIDVTNTGGANTIFLNLNVAAEGPYNFFGYTVPTSTTFKVGSSANINGATYVAYLFAHNAGGFGLTGTDNVISCGSYTGNGSFPNTITLGYEPQWVMIKKANAPSGINTGWVMFDNMRGMGVVGTAPSPFLYANASDAESSSYSIGVTATGFEVSTQNIVNTSGDTYIYIAIRRGPMKVPTSGTSVFQPLTRNGTGGATTVTSTVRPDTVLQNWRSGGLGSANHFMYDRLRGVAKALFTDTTDAESTQTATGINAFNNLSYGIAGAGSMNNGSALYADYVFTRAPSFFDEVCWTGDGNNPRSLSHNLTVAPELIITKKRNAVSNWITGYDFTATAYKYLYLNDTGAATSDTYASSPVYGGQPTASVFVVGNQGNMNISGDTYVSYLFATCAGVSKVGSYTGTGATQTISCGFAGGARFVLIKRTNSTGDWYVWDTARGMVSGTDPSLLLNSTAAEVNANSIYTTTGGFQIVSTAAGINASGGTYIYLAIA